MYIGGADIAQGPAQIERVQGLRLEAINPSPLGHSLKPATILSDTVKALASTIRIF